MSQTLSNKMVMARKPHRCYLCGRIIWAGEPYIRRSGSGDNGFWSIAIHSECDKATDKWDTMDWKTYGEDHLSFCTEELRMDSNQASNEIPTSTFSPTRRKR